MAEYVTQKEALELTGISRATLYRYIDEGLPFQTVGARSKLFDIGELKSFIERRRSDVAKDLVVGKEYSNAEIAQIFNCSNMGGMRRSHSKNALVLISFNDGEEHLYSDYWRDDILYYSGMGQSGDQSFEYAQNKTLLESEKNGITVYLFEMFTNKKYQYRGIVKLAGEPFMSDETDINGVTRKVCKYPLKLVNGKDYLDEEFVKEEEKTKQKLAEDYIKAGREFVEQHFSQPISELTVVAKHTAYNAVVGAYVKLRADGKCELCGNDAPFYIDGEPYLEITHIVPYCDGGVDSVDNTAALCPNCAARLMRLRDAADKDKLKNNIKAHERTMSDKLHGRRVD